MVTLPLYTFLILYIVFVMIVVALKLVNVYHIASAQALNTITFTVSFLILVLTIGTLYLTFYFLQGTNWYAPVILFDPGWFSIGTPTF